MKKMLCLALALVMALSLAIPAMAAVTNNSGGTTTVTYDASNPGEGGSATQENWTVTVPATMAPGGSGNVTVEGQWGASKKLVVGIENDATTVTLSSGDETKALAITFDGISVTGSNGAAITASTAGATKQISVANWGTSNPAPLFGTWSGTITYTAELKNV